ncbi:hypothetical protein MMIC_P1888 [Mariprofundus micogutta]|uniref:PepSY-associated TM helix n=1 Tax=Mariprofundus micogutta TaxID=1921010 RepID=A0A1L8CPR3_9PROT|nr:hypothetical protein [Mariprofundus micogutta]GAV20912.1 hypothetical protein MMIC_P1888 [Mariprofundus micogutta]
MIKRYTLMKMHMILASVVFPITLMFFLTGVFYINDIKPESTIEKFRVELDQALPRDAGLLREIAAGELARRDLSEPLGRAKLKWNSDLEVYYLFWDGENHWLKMRPSTENMNVAVFRYYTPSWYGRFMSLHKGNGKNIFNYFVIAMVIVMLLTLISGTMMGLSLPKQRKLVLRSMGAGFVVFFALVLYSQFV